MLEALEHHPLRTTDPNVADMFIVPIRIGAHIVRERSMTEAFEALFRTPLFQRHQGHRHVILSLTQPAFDYSSIEITEAVGLTAALYERLENVTIARDHDVFGATDLYPDDGYGFKTLFEKQRPVTNSGFSIGMPSGPRIPNVEASWSKFLGSSIQFFHQTNKNDFLHGSTNIQRLPVSDRVQEAFDTNKSSLGFGIMGRSQWLSAYADSQFCLVVRGDQPHARSLMRAVKMGCIPVVISDYYEQYAPTFPSMFNMSLFTIKIPEATFMADPVESLKNVLGTSEELLQDKIHMLRIVQKAFAHDHQQSLFVQSFLKEATVAMIHSQPTRNIYHLDPHPIRTHPDEMFSLAALRLPDI